MLLLALHRAQVALARSANLRGVVDLLERLVGKPLFELPGLAGALGYGRRRRIVARRQDLTKPRGEKQPGIGASGCTAIRGCCDGCTGTTVGGEWARRFRLGPILEGDPLRRAP